MALYHHRFVAASGHPARTDSTRGRSQSVSAQFIRWSNFWKMDFCWNLVVSFEQRTWTIMNYNNEDSDRKRWTNYQSETSGETWRSDAESDKSRESGLSPVSKPDATERSGSIPADKQTQVAVWKPETQKLSEQLLKKTWSWTAWPTDGALHSRRPVLRFHSNNMHRWHHHSWGFSRLRLHFP